MTDTGLRRRGAPVAVALAVTSLAGVIADIVGLSQILALSGTGPLLILYPLSGIGLGIVAIGLMPVVDKWARLPMLRSVGLLIAGAYAISFALLGVSPLVAVSLVWIVAALQNYLYPMLIWSLSADIFNVTQSRQINGWIGSWGYVGRLAALLTTTVAPALAVWAGAPLTILLVIPPLLTAGLAVWLPRQLRNVPTSMGERVQAGPREALRSGWRFVHEVPIWRWLLTGTAVTAAAGATVSIGVATASQTLLGQNAGLLQAYIGGIQLVATVLSLAVQRWWTRKVMLRIGIRGGLLVQPTAVILASLLLAISLVTGQLAVLTLAALLWRVPEWTVDQTAKTAALGYVPDQRRARVSLLLVLCNSTAAWVLCALLAAPALLVGPLWLVGAVPAVVALFAFIWWGKVYRGWDNGLLDWHLRRRKRAGFGNL